MYNWNGSRVVLSARQSLGFFQCVLKRSRKKFLKHAQPRMIEHETLRVHRPPLRPPHNYTSAFKDLTHMSFTMSQASLPVFEIGLNALWPCSTKQQPISRRRKSIHPYWSAGDLRRICSLLVARSRSPATKPRTARQGSRVLNHQNSKTRNNARPVQGTDRQNCRFSENARHQGDRCLIRT